MYRLRLRVASIMRPALDVPQPDRLSFWMLCVFWGVVEKKHRILLCVRSSGDGVCSLSVAELSVLVSSFPKRRMAEG